MAEMIPKFPFKAHYVMDGNGVILELYRLLAIFHSSKELVSFKTSNHEEPIEYLLSFQESEVTRILIHSASIARIVDDQHGSVLKDYGGECGTWIKNIEMSENVEPLPLREACNKIIHAKKIHLDMDEIECGHYLKPFVHFYGDYKGKSWKVSLNINDYILNYVSSVGKFLVHN